MSRRNVDLVITAKDEAEKVLRKITSALEDFSNATKGVDGGAEKAESSLGQLGAAINSLEKNLGGLNIADKLSSELVKTEKVLTGLEDKFDKTKQEAKSFEAQLNRVGASAERFKSKLAGATEALDRQKTSIAAAKKNQSELAASYKVAETAQARLEKRQAKLPALLDKQVIALDKAKARYADLADRIEQTSQPSRTLQAQFEASTRSVDQNTTKLKKLTTEYGEIGGKIRVAGSAMTIFSGQSENAAAGITKQERVLTKIEDNLVALKGKSKAASAEQGKLAANTRATAKALDSQKQAISQAEDNYVGLAVAAGKADKALADLASRSLSKLAKSLKDQRLATLRAKKGYLDLSAEATRLATNIREATKPTQEMVAAFDRTKVAAGAAKKEYAEQRVALELMGRAYRGTGTDIESINGTQKRFQAILTQTSVALKSTATSTDKMQRELDQLHGSSTRAAGSMGRTATAARRLAAANERGAKATGRFAAAYRQFYGDSRRSLSLLQRIRGNVLSLVSAYVGLYGIIEVLRGTVDATQQLEAAQSRLTVAFEGDYDAAAKELDFLRRTSDRLGLSFGSLATEYSKFAIATQGTNLAGENTRKIFLAVAEAARVNRSSTSEMAGVFVALTQIVSKGAVQMEELRQQLGDRLPGAIKIMADGLGVGTAELIKMMEAGEITADALVPFADELTKKFGKGLPDALNSVSTSIGKLANEAFEALLRFGEAGFLESFQKFADRLTAVLQTADFQAFADRASRALGGLMDVLAFGAENFDLLIAALAGFIGLKLTPIFIAIAGSMNLTTAASARTTASFAVLQARAASMGVSVTRAGLAIRGLRKAMLALLSTTGLGLLVAAIGTGIAIWATSATDASEAMIAHKDVLDQVKNAYDLIGQSVQDWRDASDTFTEEEAVKNLRRLDDALVETGEQFDDVISQAGDFWENFFAVNRVGGVSGEYRDSIREIVEEYKAGRIEADKFIPALSAVNKQYDDGSDGVNDYAASIIKFARVFITFVDAQKQGQDAVTALTAELGEAQEAYERLNDVTKETADPLDDFAKAFEKLAKSSSELIDSIPKSTSKIEEAAAEAERLAAAYQEALKAARALPEAIQRAAAEQKVMTAYTEGMAAAVVAAEGRIGKTYDQFTTGIEAAAAFLRKKEGFIGQAAYDVNADRVGFGSDTLTSREGVVTSVQPGSTTTIEAANRDLTRRLTDEFIPAVVNAVGAARYESLSAQQQAALISLAYNYGAAAFQPGDDLAGIAEQVRTGTTEGVVAAITARAGDNDGANRPRRIEEAALYGSTGGVEFAVDEINARNEAETEFHGTLKDEIETRRQEAALQSASLIRQEQGKAIREAELEAKREGTTLSEDERQAINETVAAKFAQKQEEEGIRDAKQAAALAEAKVNALLAQRRALDKRLAISEEQGDTTKTAELQERLAAVNAELTQAIDAAKLMWEAIGGDAATNAIIKLDTAALSADTLTESAKKTYLQWDRVGDLFVTGLASAFDTFSKSVSEGENIAKAAGRAFLQFAADFLIQIAQMIIQQAIFNALSGALGGTGLGQSIGVGHTGGLVGSSRVGSGNGTRRVSGAMFAGAVRYHTGGIIGLKPGEIPIIAQQGEEMLTRDDPRHMLNGGAGTGGGTSATKGTTIINTFDAEEMLERALATPRGEEVILNTIRGKRTEIKAVLG